MKPEPTEEKGGDVSFVPTPDSPEIGRRCPFDPPDAYSSLRDAGELGRLRFRSGREAWLLTSHDDVAAMLTDQRFSSAANMLRDVVTDGDTPGWLFGMDGPEHAHYRRFLTGGLAMRAMRRMEPRIERIVARRLAAIARGGAPADLFAQFAWPVPLLVMRDVLGVPEQEWEEFEKTLAAADEPGASRETRRASFRAAWEYLLGLIRLRRRSPGDDLISDLFRERPAAGGAIEPEEGASLILSLRLGGHAPVAHVLAMSIFVLLADDRRLDPAGGHKQLDAAVDELLRYIPSNNLGVVRTAAEEVALTGATIHAGDLVCANLPVANRDPARFGHPDTLDLERGFSPHLAFGHGPHRCPGRNLARLELRVALTALFREFPTLRLAVEPGDVVMENSSTTYSVTELPVAW